MIKSLKDGNVPSGLITALLLETFQNYILTMGNTIRWLIRNDWEDSGISFMNQAYSHRSSLRDVQATLTEIVEVEMKTQIFPAAKYSQKRFTALDWPNDWESFAGWMMDTNFGVDIELSVELHNDISGQWNEIRRLRRKKIKDQIFLYSSGGMKKWFINPLENNAQMAIKMIAYALLNCNDQIWQDVLSTFKKDINHAKSLLFTSSGRFYGLELYEEWLIIIIATIAYEKEDSNNRAQIFVDKILEDLLPYIRSAEIDNFLWDYTDEKPIINRNQYLINQYLIQLPDNKNCMKLKEHWKNLATTVWPWMTED